MGDHYGRLGKADKMSLDLVVTKRGELATGTLKHTTEKLKAARVPRFFQGDRKGSKFAGKIHFSIIFNFGLFSFKNVLCKP